MPEFSLAIVGLGGIGGIVADNLYPFLRAEVEGWSLRNLIFIDNDTYSRSNIPRQKAASAMLGVNKAHAWKGIYDASQSNAMGTTFTSIGEWITNDSIGQIFYDNAPTNLVIMSCVDNHPARLVMSRYVQSLLKENDQAQCVVIQAGCDRGRATADLYGRWGGLILGQPIEQGHPEVLEEREGDRDEISCEELANLPSGDQTFVDNWMAASMAINILFTMLSQHGPTALSKYIGEWMDNETHYHQIDRVRSKHQQQLAEAAAANAEGQTPAEATPAQAPEPAKEDDPVAVVVAQARAELSRRKFDGFQGALRDVKVRDKFQTYVDSLYKIYVKAGVTDKDEISQNIFEALKGIYPADRGVVLARYVDAMVSSLTGK